MHPKGRCNAFYSRWSSPTPSNTGFGTPRGFKCNTYVGEGKVGEKNGSLALVLAPEVYHSSANQRVARNWGWLLHQALED